MPDFYFVIDTENYAGNFERQMCAYITGETGDCGVGREEADLFQEDEREGKDEDYEPFDLDLVGSEPDDHGCFRPVKIYATPGWFNNGTGGHYRESEPGVMERAQSDYVASVRAYAETIRLRYTDKVAGNKLADAHLLENVGKAISKYPAYLSVAICLQREPTEEEITFFKNRARKFGADFKDYDKSAPLTITGFRLVTVRTVVESRAI